MNVHDWGVSLPFAGGGGAWIADVDGDGADDVWAGAPWEGLTMGVARLALGPFQPPPPAVLTFTGKRGLDTFGVADLTGDGVPDLLAGDQTGQYLVDGTLRGDLGPADAVLLTGGVVSAATVWGEPRILAANASVHGQGTVSAAGRVYVGPSPLPPGTTVDLVARADGWFEGTVEYDLVGYSTAAGDLDGDGVDDLVLGSGSGLYVADEPPVGVVYVTSLHRLEREAGLLVVAAGDLDGDGRDDAAALAYREGTSLADVLGWLSLPPDGSDAAATADLVVSADDPWCTLDELDLPDVDRSGEADLFVGYRSCGPSDGVLFGLYGPVLAGTYDVLSDADVTLIGRPAELPISGPVRSAELTGDDELDLLLGQEVGPFLVVPGQVVPQAVR